MSFQRLNKSCFYLQGACNIGLIVNDGQGIVIDSGIDKDAVKKISKYLDELGVEPVAVINTHAHADHCGGNANFKKRYPNIKIYASALERALIEQPYYEGFYLFGGGEPPAEMRGKFLKAEASIVDVELNAGPINIAGIEIDIVLLPGHTAGQIGIKYEDVFYTADAFFGAEIVAKYGVPYFTDILATLTTLEIIKKFNGYVIPCHGEGSKKFVHDIEINILAINRTKDLLLEVLTEPCTEQGMVKALADSSNLKLKALGQYYLTKATVMSYLSLFIEEGTANYEIISNCLHWQIK